MTKEDLVSALRAVLPDPLPQELVEQFLILRQDVATRTLGRGAPGKFVETIVQAFQFLESDTFDARPDVDAYLRGLESRPSKLHDGLRICAGRIARAMYSLRSKRGIAHKGEVDPSLHDLEVLHAMAQWMIGELVRTLASLPVDDAARLLAQVHAPIGGLVEDFGGRRLVLRDLTAEDEILLLLHSHYPEVVAKADLLASLDRQNTKTISNTMRRLWRARLIEGDWRTGYQLTQAGFGRAIEVIRGVIDA